MKNQTDYYLTYQLISIGIAFVIFIILVYKLISGDVKFNGNNRPFSYGISDDFTAYILGIIISGAGGWPIFLIMYAYFSVKDKLKKKRE